jgi:hypothetical protein
VKKNSQNKRFQPLKQMQKRNQDTKKPWRPFLFVSAALCLIAVVAIVQKPGTSHAAPFSPACEPHGFLFQYQNNPPNLNTPPTYVDAIYMVTNSLNNVAHILGHTVNAVGYNVLDNFMYGWDNYAGGVPTPVNTNLVRIHNDYTVEPITTLQNPPAGGLGIIAAGDVDPNGQYWFVTPTHWHHIDLTTDPPTYIGNGLVHNAGGPPLGLPTGASEVLDIAYVPATFANGNRAGMYTIVTVGGEPRLYRMDISTPSSPTWEFIGSLASDMTSTDAVVGALYADAYGVLYAGSNVGGLWRIIIGNTGLGIPLDAFKIAPGSPANGNDGARCANAYYPVDFGDAPLSYITNWDQPGGVGPIHAIGNFNSVDSTAPLMLGEKVDIEPDGFPGTAADGDDKNHPDAPFVNDEDGVQHIVAPPTPTTLAVPVTVTNNNSSPATLAGWIDLDSSGTFDSGERVLKDIPANSGKAMYELSFPNVSLSANTYARFRVFQGSGLDDSILQPNGIASVFTIGEVEDHLVQVGSYGVQKSSTPATGSTVAPEQSVTYNLKVTNTGSTDLVGLTIHDDLTNVLDDATIDGSPTVNPSSGGSASVIGNRLQFDGDIPAGQSVTVSYAVKVKPAGQLANKTMRNLVIAAHSNCHPTINGQTVTVNDSNCKTEHPIDAELARTGQDMWVYAFISGLLLSAGLFMAFKLGPIKI